MTHGELAVQIQNEQMLLGDGHDDILADGPGLHDPDVVPVKGGVEIRNGLSHSAEIFRAVNGRHAFVEWVACI